jgi:hypothetical protein
MTFNWTATRNQKGLACRIPKREKVVVFPFESPYNQPGFPTSIFHPAGSLLATKATEKLEQE